MSKPLVIGLDLGTTTAKALAVDPDSHIVASASRSVELNCPSPGYATQSPDDYLAAVCDAIKDLASQVDVDQIQGLAISGAMHSIIPLDDHNHPLADGLTWADRRGTGHLAQLRSQVDTAGLHRRTGCPLRSLYHAPRLRDLADENFASKAARFISMKEWVILHLTGTLACDRAFASTTGLYHLHDRDWDQEALSLAGINADRLSPLVDCHAAAGKLKKTIADKLNLPENLPIIPGSTDGALANLGAAGGQPGRLVMTVGTSGAVRQTVTQPAVDPREQTWCYLIADELYIRGGAINNGGLTAEWVVHQCYADLPDDQQFPTMFREAAKVEPGADGLTFLPYLTGERTPLWNPDAAASLCGLKRHHTRGHIARAALEAVVFCLRDVYEAVRSGDPSTEHASAEDQPICLTGGITHSTLWCQIVADVFNRVIDPCRQADGSAIGAARLGHWALGHVNHLADFSPLPTHDAISPNPQNTQRYEEIYHRFQQLKLADA